MDFTGQRVVVIGASAGIGEATALAFAEAGADVIITGRSKERLDAAVQRIGRGVQARECDAADDEAVRSLFESVGKVDYLVLVASPGAVGSGPFATLAPDALRQAFDGKFFAYVRVLQAALPVLRADGSVTMISAISARTAYPGAAGLAAASPVRRVGTPEDVAAAVLYLSGAGFVTGTVAEVAGGANLTVGAMAS